MLVMTLLVKNERDIVEANLKYHLARGVDHVIVTDNGSTDGTRDILSDYARTHPVSVLDEAGDDYSQHRWVTRMALSAASDHGAAWIINNDADEFWTAERGTLREALDAAQADIVMCERRNMVFSYDAPATTPWHQRLIYRAQSPTRPQPMTDPLTSPLTAPHFMRALPGKAALRGAGLVAVQQGNHGATYDRDVLTSDGAIVIYHYPVRSHDQFELKVRQGGAAYARNTELPVNIGWHWRRWLAKIEQEGLHVALAEALPSRSMVEAGLRDGSIVHDALLVELLDEILRSEA